MDPNQQNRSVPLNLTPAASIKLIELASYYGIPLENVSEVVIQGLKVLEAIKDSGSDSFTTTGNGQTRTFNVREL